MRSEPPGPRVAPLWHEDKLYTLGAEGNLCCLDANNGKLIWSRELKRDYKISAPMWGFAGHPLIEGNKLICLVGGERSTVVAFDKDSGKEIWRALTAQELNRASGVVPGSGRKDAPGFRVPDRLSRVPRRPRLT